MKNLLKSHWALFALSAVLLFPACSKNERSATTGWMYNDQDWGGFEKRDYEGQITGPNLVLVEGGTFTMGQTQEDVMFEWAALPRRVTVSSFYMDETEVTNIDYREFVYWVDRVWGETYPETYFSVLPDTLVWRDELVYNEPYVQAYFRHPSYDFYPVVGVNWFQANEYCRWRTDRVNEMILIEKGLINPAPEQRDENNFNTEAYLLGRYQPDVRKNLTDYQTGGERQVRYEDGILLPSYRLPTEAEWEYAALSLQGNMASENDERITDRRNFPWDGSTVRYQRRNKYQGDILANFKRGRGDYMGMAGNLNDQAPIPGKVATFMPNDFGLYNMAGNVSEWTADLYRPLTSLTLRDADEHDLNPYRGNKFQTQERDEDGNISELDSLGRVRYRYVTDEEAAGRENYTRGQVYNYLDGDKESEAFYDYGKSTLINDEARVIKGGSWSDRAFWLSPGARRYMQEDKASRSLGFRCAMTRVGAPQGNDGDGGNTFKEKQKKVRRRYK
jgi:gliding motility-associated lipoprotein GldJ